MKFGVNTFIWSAGFDHSNLPLLPRIKSWGFDGVEVPLFRPTEFAAADIRKGVEANALECTICSVLVKGLSLISTTPTSAGGPPRTCATRSKREPMPVRS